MNDPDEIQAAINAALDKTLGFHGQWVLAVECMDQATGELEAPTMPDPDGAAWTQLGLAHMLVLDLSAQFRQNYRPEGDA